MNLFLSLGASVVNGDIKPPLEEPSSSTPTTTFTYVRTDVTVWADLVTLFKKTIELYGRVDHVFANAGVLPRAEYLATKVDSTTGDLLEPSHMTFDVNLRGVVNTTTLAVYHMRQQQDPPGGSVVMGCSIAAMQRFRAVDYGKLGSLLSYRPRSHYDSPLLFTHFPG